MKEPAPAGANGGGLGLTSAHMHILLPFSEFSNAQVFDFLELFVNLQQDRHEADTPTQVLACGPLSLADIGDRIVGEPLNWVRFYQLGGEEPWREVSEREVAKLDKLRPMFATVCAAAQVGDSWLHISDVVWLDWDADEIGEAIAAVKRFLVKLEGLGVNPACCRWFASGGKGFHCEMPLTLFKQGGVDSLTRNELENLPQIVKGVVSDGALFVDTLDMRVYSGGKGRQWRMPNVLRSNGKYKVQVSPDELQGMTASAYDAITASPRNLFKPAEADYCPALGAIWAASAATLKASASAKASKVVTVNASDPRELERAASALAVLDPDDYTTWLQSGMALQADLGEAGFDVWNAWASTGAKYKSGECLNLWSKHFADIGANGVHLATVYKWARNAGWRDPYPELNPLADPAKNPAARPRYSDAGMAEFIAAKHSDCVKYAADLGVWLIWDGRKWYMEGDGATVYQLLKDERRNLLRLAADEAEDEKREGMVKFAASLESRRTIENIKKLVLLEPAMRVESGLLDQHPWLLNVRNGILDLKTGALLPHDPTKLMTQLAPVDFDSAAQCPRWLQFVREITKDDTGLAKYLQCMAGYCLSGDVSRHEAYYLHGGGSNGKSVFMNTLRKLLGSYAATLKVEAIMVRREPGASTPDLSALRGVRLAITSELARGQQLASGIFKDLASADPLSVREPYQKRPVILRPVCKLVLPSNFLPTVAENDEGTWRRIRAIPFDAHFEGPSKDPGLEWKLVAELSGILNWALEGLRMVLADEMRLPERVQAKTQAYRDSMDTVKRFVSECMVQDEPGQEPGRIAAGDLHSIFRAWCQHNGVPVASGRVFGEDIADKVPKVRGRGGVVYSGWRVWSDAVPDAVLEKWTPKQRAAAIQIAEDVEP